jgi:hypothetical protein
MRRLWLMLLFYLVWVPLVSADDGIGRLFFTPEQRQHLQRLRLDKQQPFNRDAAEADGVRPLLSSLPEEKIQGYVKRHEATFSTVWRNGKPSQLDSNHVPE